MLASRSYSISSSITQQQFPSSSLFYPYTVRTCLIWTCSIWTACNLYSHKVPKKRGKNPKAWMMREEYSFWRLKHTIIKGRYLASLWNNNIHKKWTKVGTHLWLNPHQSNLVLCDPSFLVCFWSPTIKNKTKPEIRLKSSFKYKRETHISFSL